MDLTGKVCVVTGASSGIGEACALALAEHGAKVVLTARREERLRDLAERIAQSGSEALAIAADARDEAALVAVFASAQERLGGVDVLINNAGLGTPASLHGGSTEAWRTMWEVNVLALAIATREALARFPEAGGHIVNIGSMAGHRVPPLGGFYSATKYAVRALTEALRQELRERKSPTRVSAISPGYVETEFFDVYHDGDAEAVRNTYNRFEVLKARDVAASVLHVLTAPARVSIHDVLMRPTDQPT
jgi:NADP-dependent 3-hydroxy acid dehydrogenase YdfG